MLFTLPKIIIKSEKQLAMEKKPVADDHDEKEHQSDVKAAHTTQISENEKNRIDRFRNSYFSVLNKEKKSNFADSLIRAFRSIHQYDSAAKYSEVVSEMNPTALNWTKTADVYMEAFNFASDKDKATFSDKAKVFYSKAIDKEPNNLEVKSKLALTYIGGENPMQGIKILREVLKQDSKNESALYNLGILSIQSGQYDKAVKRFEELLNVNPKHSTGQFYLGVAWANLGDKTKALESFNKARKLETDPEFQATVDSYIKDLQ
jgi:tetratricopeptide (TPR) repeat protein